MYERDPDQRAKQLMLMKVMDDLADVLFVVIMSRGTHEQSLKKMQLVLTKLEDELKQSPTQFFQGKKHYMMPDVYGLPHISRIFYLKGSALNTMFETLEIEKRYPLLQKWVLKSMRERPELNDGRAIIKIEWFHKWVEELMTYPIGKKPPLRIPMAKL